jgi:hypothetical protein
MFDDHDWYPDKHDEYWDQLRDDIEYEYYKQELQDEIPLQPKQPKHQWFDEDDRLVVRPWSELDDEPDREMVVEDIQFVQGVTSIVAPYGGGKTVFAVAVAMTIGTGGMWAGEWIEQMPVLWAAADDRRTLQSVRKAWMDENPGRSLMKEGGWINGPVTFSDVGKTRELIRWLKGKPPMLIVLDMLTDMFGDLDDEKGKDAIKVFKNIWWVVRETGATFLCLQWPTWRDNRPKGSINIPGKNDIVLFIRELNLERGHIDLEHLKRREGSCGN